MPRLRTIGRRREFADGIGIGTRNRNKGGFAPCNEGSRHEMVAAPPPDGCRLVPPCRGPGRVPQDNPVGFTGRTTTEPPGPGPRRHPGRYACRCPRRDPDDPLRRDGRTRIYRSSDSGASWAEANEGLPAGSSVTAIVTKGTWSSPGRSGPATSPRRARGSGRGRVPIGLTDRKILSLAASETRLFVGTHRDGVFISTNHGRTWSPRTQGCPPLQLMSLPVRGESSFAASTAGHATCRRTAGPVGSKAGRRKPIAGGGRQAGPPPATFPAACS